MNKADFIKQIRTLADKVEKGDWYFIRLGEGEKDEPYIFANKNYGEVSIPLSGSCNVHINLFSATDEEKAEFPD